MKTYYNINEKIVFVGQYNKKYKHKLNMHETYTIYDRLEHQGVPLNGQKLYYAVLDNIGIVTSWFEFEDFILLSEYRKLKLKKINNKIC